MATREALTGCEEWTLLPAPDFDVTAPPRTLAASAEAFPRSETVVLPGPAHFPGTTRASSVP
ncbi:hypothetical protein [Streptomyces peucetius]|uniref:Uncharacterized protein n=1 Tax=Streptomyces peucetius TaxID=1950 RepID=A0ABY6IHG9_STRPE|nr:hypothetical protein [Streptomyces peucetius]UYQ65362.1 hypothetical protein OGH68_30455 [Streptomyces peucetius]